MSSTTIREALKREFGRNKAGLIERIKEHPLLRDEDYALILSYEDRPAKITVDKLIDLYLSYPAVNSPQSNSPKSTTRKASRNASNTETHVRDHLQMLPMEDIQAIGDDLRLPINNYHESQRSRIISLIIGKLVHRHSSVSGHNALSNAKAAKVMRKIDSRYKEVYKSYMNAPTRKQSKVSVVKFHNS
jgi:hypothetical protein